MDNASSFENDLIVPTTNSLTEGQRPAVPGQHLALRDAVMRRTPRPAFPRFSFEMETLKRVCDAAMNLLPTTGTPLIQRHFKERR